MQIFPHRFLASGKNQNNSISPALWLGKFDRKRGIRLKQLGFSLFDLINAQNPGES
jgi:hypothetical protein